MLLIGQHGTVTFNPFPEIIAVPSHGCELAQVVIGAPDVHVLVLRAADDEGVVVAAGKTVA